MGETDLEKLAAATGEGATVLQPSNDISALSDQNANHSAGSEGSSSEQEVIGTELQPINSTVSYEAADTKTKIIIVSALCMNLFLCALDQTIVSTALPAIIEDLGGNVAYSWVGSSYLIASSAFIPSWGKFSDIWGRKPIIMVGSVIFLVGSILTAAAKDMGTLIAGRTIQGFGGGGIMVLVNITVSDIVTMRERGKYLAAVGATWAISSAIGPIIGGAFATNASWRWCFIINIPIGLIAMVVIWYFLHLHSPKIGVMEGLKQVDWLGSLFAVGGTTLFLVGIDSGGVTEPWNSPLVLSCLIIGSTMLVSLIFIEWKVTANPIMPPRVFGHRTALASYVICFLHAQTFIAGAFYLPLYFQSALGKTPLMSGVLNLPFVFMLSIGSMGTGIVIAKTGNYRPIMRIGLVFMAAGAGAFVDWDRTSSMVKIIFFQFIAGFGLGPNFQSPLIAIHSTIQPADIAVATGAFAFIRNLACAIGVSVGNVIFANEFNRRIPSIMQSLSPETVRLISGNGGASSTGAVSRLPANERIPIQDAYAESLSVMWWYFVGVSVAALLFSLLVGKHTLSTKLESVQPAKARKKSEKAKQAKENVGDGPEVAVDEKGGRRMVGNDVV
ncbi:hypothetical protein TWF225_000963 [Orbilia oligospora]|uniref:Uncharacterized protein n=1 Tax=Orbilia oligospora TaxID=2813651 RepID=A0A7C8PMZ2_ORBOL|nr:hypothetical protein TWF751_004461 [Orbilia oligospora]KAF3191742.1 hypothetical protein TWF225_000963 [Orbilia oligospora]KAF3250644.1 hypothetical protein TWF128_007490 [Orbilia oligospora]KAF3266857.1 hypothetical protein TWF217_000947 [Orbilia oligospora]KAF3297288.1 hypothetical protein TWF132_007391 [Orbilia oligospora]